MDIKSLTENTKVKEVLNAFPGLKDKLIEKYSELKALDNPLMKGIVENATLKDVCSKLNVDLDTIKIKLEELVAGLGK